MTPATMPPVRAADTVHVLVVDDSAVVRQMMTAVLAHEPGIHGGRGRAPADREDQDGSPSARRDRPGSGDAPRGRARRSSARSSATDPIPPSSSVRHWPAGEPTPCCAPSSTAPWTSCRSPRRASRTSCTSRPSCSWTRCGARRAHAPGCGPRPRDAAHHRTHRRRGAAARRRALLSVTTDKVIAIGTSTGGTEALRRLADGTSPRRSRVRRRPAHARGLHRGVRRAPEPALPGVREGGGGRQTACGPAAC